MGAFLVAETNTDAWRAAASHLLEQRGCEDDNLIVQIERPGPSASKRSLLDPRGVSASGEDPSDVANTIFPKRTWQNAKSRDDFYERYKKAHARGGRKSWGTYFLRLTNFGATGVNQLERAIRVMNEWQNEPGTAIVLHLSSPETDLPRPLGGPCLQLLQLHAKDGRLDVTAIYRNHDYFNKALPNFIGLGGLLEFICKATDRQVGSLTCHSGHAYSSAGKLALRRLVESI